MVMQRLYKIGELASAAGLSVRTLRHYEEVGLLAPQARTEAGYRVYGDAAVRRLYQIVALRQLGMGLEQIGAVLEGAADPMHVVKQHLEAIERALDLHGELRDRLLAVLATLDRSEEPTTDEFLEAVEVMSKMEQYYTPEQLTQLEERRKELGEDGMLRAQQEWGDLIDEAKALKDSGVDPTDARVQAIVTRWNELIEAFTGGDPGIRASLRKMYESEGPEKASRNMVDPELMEWVARAQRAGS